MNLAPNTSVCDICGSESFVIDSRRYSDGTIRRRRKCQKCGARWSTVELRIKSNKRGFRFMDQYKIVDFKYCNWCVHETVNEKDEPCAECLNEPVNMNSHRPIKFEPSEKFNGLLDSGLLNM